MPHADAELKGILRGRDARDLGAWLSTVPTRELAQSLRLLASEDLRRVISQIDDPRAQELVPLLDGAVQAELFRSLPADRAGRLFAALDPDDRVRALQQVPEVLSRALLASLAAPAADVTRQLMAYPPNSAGRAMSPHVLSVRAADTTEEALDRVSRAPQHVETIYMLPVVDDALLRPTPEEIAAAIGRENVAAQEAYDAGVVGEGIERFWRNRTSK